MKDHLSKLASIAATGGMILVGCVIAGLGLSVTLVLALFGLAAIGLALLASPLIALAQKTNAYPAQNTTDA